MSDCSRFIDWQYPTVEDGVPTKYHWLVQNSAGLELGYKTDIGAFTYINARFGVVLEDDVQVGSHCSIYSVSTIDNKQGRVVLKKNCKVGSHSTVMPGVTIGENSVVGAHSLVTSDIPADSVAVGVPAKVIKKILPELRKSRMKGDVNKRIFLSAPHMGGEELDFVHEAFSSNYIAPVGPQLDAFEQEFAEMVGAGHAAAVSSGTAALHLLLRYVGVSAGDEVFCSTFTFVASANPILYRSAVPVLVDSDYTSWNMDPVLLAMELENRAAENCLPMAVVLVHLYGQPADIDPIKEVCDRHDVVLIEDAAEALGAMYKGKAPGTFGLAGFYSFNGNKIITTSGGGMIVSDDEALIQKVRFWATQARENALHYEHTEIGYNYRMSNVLAAIGRGQLRVLKERVNGKRKIFRHYQGALGDLPGVSFMPEPDFARSTRWLTCLTIDSDKAGVNRDMVIEALEKQNIESRPTWKPMHIQPLYQKYKSVGGMVAQDLFQNGICLPSGTGMSSDDLERVITTVRACWSY